MWRALRLVVLYALFTTPTPAWGQPPTEPRTVRVHTAKSGVTVATVTERMVARSGRFIAHGISWRIRNTASLVLLCRRQRAGDLHFLCDPAPGNAS